MRPKGVIDAQQVNIPAPAVEVEPHVTCLQGRSPGQMWGLGALQGVTARPFCCRSRWRRHREKPCGDDTVARTKTDTGRRDEHSQALERTLVKELGKLTP